MHMPEQVHRLPVALPSRGLRNAIRKQELCKLTGSSTPRPRWGKTQRVVRSDGAQQNRLGPPVFHATEHRFLVRLLPVQNYLRGCLALVLYVCVFMPVCLAAGTTVVAAIPVVPLLCGTGAAGGKDAPREPATASEGSVSQEGL